ncbi:MAG TPA: iron-sulfur cluster assembly accessory protein [Polyangiaceae bacterium]|jgi:iron-sulfur cluster assembly protein
METSTVNSAAPSQSSGEPATESVKSRREITISDKAVEFAKKKLAARGTPNAAVRLGVKGGGCSGFSYVIQYEDTPPRERDTVYEVDGVRFYVDKKSFVYLAGSVLDYEQTLMFQGFKFKNPQEASSCGCGHSFTVK